MNMYIIMFKSDIKAPPPRRSVDYSASLTSKRYEEKKEEGIMHFNTFLQWKEENGLTDIVLQPSSAESGLIMVLTTSERAAEIRKLDYVDHVMQDQQMHIC